MIVGVIITVVIVAVIVTGIIAVVIGPAAGVSPAALRGRVCAGRCGRRTERWHIDALADNNDAGRR